MLFRLFVCLGHWFYKKSSLDLRTEYIDFHLRQTTYSNETFY